MYKLATHWVLSTVFSEANTAWTNGTVKRMMHEVIHGAKAMFDEDRRPISEWVVVLPAVK